MSVTGFFRYLSGYEASRDLAIQLIEVHSDHVDAQRRRAARAA